MLHEFVDLYHQRLIGSGRYQNLDRGEERPTQINVQAIVDVGLQRMFFGFFAARDFFAVFDAAIVNLFRCSDHQLGLSAVVMNQCTV